MCDNKGCNKEAMFGVWIHRNITINSFFCSDKCCINYARERGWKYSKEKKQLYKDFYGEKKIIYL